MAVSFGLCLRCLRTLQVVGRMPKGPQSGPLARLVTTSRGIRTRHLSLWSFFKGGSLNESTNDSSKQPEKTLTEAFQKAEAKRLAEQETANKLIARQLESWGESRPIDESTVLPFRDPLGHLTFQEQKAYLANPPSEYLETLEDRAKRRELFERELFYSDPIKNWRLCYAQKPDFSGDTLPQWKPWSEQWRLDVMEKYRRYDERLQRKIQEIYEKCDSAPVRERTKKTVALRIRKEAKTKAIAARKSKKEAKREANAMEEPPPAVLEMKALRKTVEARNDALNQLWARHIIEVMVFESISEDGLMVSEAWKKKAFEIGERKKVEEAKRKVALEEWSNMATDSKATKIDWDAIHGEI